TGPRCPHLDAPAATGQTLMPIPSYDGRPRAPAAQGGSHRLQPLGTDDMIEQLLTIARNTFTESIRQPIFLVLVLLGGAALVLNPALTAYTMEDDNKLLVDLSLSTILLVGLMLAAFSATSVLASELEN